MSKKMTVLPTMLLYWMTFMKRRCNPGQNGDGATEFQQIPRPIVSSFWLEFEAKHGLWTKLSRIYSTFRWDLLLLKVSFLK